MYRRTYPLCDHCSEKGITKSADVVDHIIEIRDGGDPLSYDNLQALCHKCHNKKTAQERKHRTIRELVA